MRTIIKTLLIASVLALSTNAFADPCSGTLAVIPDVVYTCGSMGYSDKSSCEGYYMEYDNVYYQCEWTSSDNNYGGYCSGEPVCTLS